MIKSYKKILSKNDLMVKKYTIKGNATIIDTNKGLFVLKENKGNNIYNYLISRHFEYFPKLVDFDENYILFEYLNDIKYDDAQRAYDLMHIVSLLHSKTAYYKEIDYDEYKNIYEKLKEKINYINNYYLDIINMIESNIYMSPSEYLIARNISKIFSCIYYCNIELDKWYDLVKEEKRKRVVTLHNNLKLDNLIKNKDIYLISWYKSKTDLPIYDIACFYNMYALEFDFYALLKEYERIFPLLKEEKILLNVLISIPNKINFELSEYKRVKQVRQLLDKIFKTEKLLTSEKEETTSAKK